MDFGEAHNNAMDKGLYKYFYRVYLMSTRCHQLLREHAMDFIVWAPRKATNISSKTSTANISEEGGLQGEDIWRILSKSIVEEKLASFSQCSVEGDSQNTAISLESESNSTDSSCEMISTSKTE